MARRSTRIRDLASEAGLGLDDALVTLWDSGFDRFERPDDVVATREIRGVRRALGLTDDRREFNVEYWIGVSGLSRDQLVKRLADVGVVLTPRARRIPKNSLRKLRRMFETRPRALDLAPKPTAAQPLPPLVWDLVGRPSETLYLTVDDLRMIHQALVKDFANSADPISPPGVKEPGLLESAAHRPQTSLAGTAKYPSIEMAAAALFHSVIHNHPFYNGNKRTALVGLLAFLDENGKVLTCSQQELFKVTLRTAQHRLVPEHADSRSDREVLEIARWIRGNSRAIDRRERPMKWHRLRQRLAEFGCRMEPAPGVGNRLNIERSVEQPRRLFGPARVRILRTQVAWAGDGTEAQRNTVHKIRCDLHLDDEHGVDSEVFYSGGAIDAFITEYRRILQRLARL